MDTVVSGAYIVAGEFELELECREIRQFADTRTHYVKSLQREKVGKKEGKNKHLFREMS